MHLRWASLGLPIQSENTHPFTGDGLSFAHNGSLMPPAMFPVYVRPLKLQQYRWCETWWKHPEAWVRFEACRRAWSVLAADPGIGFSLWHRDHLGPMLHVLLSDAGTFTNCTHSASSLTTDPKHAAAGEYARQPASLDNTVQESQCAPTVACRRTHRV